MTIKLSTILLVFLMPVLSSLAEDQASSTTTPTLEDQRKQLRERVRAQKERTTNACPKLTGEDLSKHLAEVQIQAIREGKPPLSLGPFTPEQIQHLIEKKQLPKPGEPLQPGMIPATMLKNLISSGLLPEEYLKSLPETQEQQEPQEQK